MSVRDLLQHDVKSLSGKNIRLVISNLPVESNVEKFIALLKTVKDLDDFLSTNDNADVLLILSEEKLGEKIKRQLAFYVRQFEHMPALNEFLLREENQLQLRERGIPINQAKLKFFEQSGDESSQNRISTILEKFAQDFLPQNSSENLFD